MATRRPTVSVNRGAIGFSQENGTYKGFDVHDYSVYAEKLTLKELVLMSTVSIMIAKCRFVLHTLMASSFLCACSDNSKEIRREHGKLEFIVDNSSGVDPNEIFSDICMAYNDVVLDYGGCKEGGSLEVRKNLVVVGIKINPDVAADEAVAMGFRKFNAVNKREYNDRLRITSVSWSSGSTVRVSK